MEVINISSKDINDSFNVWKVSYISNNYGFIVSDNTILKGLLGNYLN